MNELEEREDGRQQEESGKEEWFWEREKKNLILKLSEPFPPEAVQRTTKEQTKKGYDTTGIGYQYAVNRFNEVLGFNWGYDYEITRLTEGTFNSGKPYFNITVEVKIWIFKPDNYRKCVGGHIAELYFDALKGAITNAFKKTAAFWGVGRQAYEGSLDDDAVYAEMPQEGEKIINNIAKPEKKQEIIPTSTSDITWAYFWNEVKHNIGITSEQAHGLFGVKTFDELIKKGYSKKRILDEIKKLAEKIKVAKPNDNPLIEDDIDLWGSPR